MFLGAFTALAIAQPKYISLKRLTPLKTVITPAGLLSEGSQPPKRAIIHFAYAILRAGCGFFCLAVGPSKVGLKYCKKSTFSVSITELTCIWSLCSL